MPGSTNQRRDDQHDAAADDQHAEDTGPIVNRDRPDRERDTHGRCARAQHQQARVWIHERILPVLACYCEFANAP
jgi:hypothetical protein